MKKLAFLGIFAASALMADEPTKKEMPPAAESVQSTAGYGSLGVLVAPWSVPVFGLGVRIQQGHMGFDASVQASTIVSATALKQNFDLLYFPKPNLASQFYTGAGVGVMEYFEHEFTQLSLSPKLIFGKEYTNESMDRRFFQAQIDCSFFKVNGHHKKVLFFPAVVLSYGILF